jgi:glycosyltransferase involved in cell wall biosynthesis
MAHKNPYVSIGLPVYNGENFLHEAITSILAQTFQDFELIISDNASTDKTEEICRAFTDQDERIKYSRNRENIGVEKNFYRVFALSSGKYFKWAAHDDLCHPDFLQSCIDVLDRDFTTVLCYPRAVIIDDKGKVIKGCHPRPLLGSHFLVSYVLTL